MDDEELFHKGFRKICKACKFYCFICGKRALDETRTRFITFRELSDNGGTCTGNCVRFESENDHVACYHCGRHVPGNKPFCSQNCFKTYPDRF